MNLQEKLQSIEENYIPHRSIHLNESTKIYLGSQENQKCRFCGWSSPNVTFNTVAHAIPQFTNNHSLINYNECDQCNAIFSKTLETHMGSYMNPYHTLSQVRGKKGVPSYNKGGEKSRIDMAKNGLEVKSVEGEREIFHFDDDKKIITFSAIRATYIPIAIYKCLTKMALSIMDENKLQYLRNTLNWINEADHQNNSYNLHNLKCFFSFTPGPLPHYFTSALLLERRPDAKLNVPHMTFVLAYGNFTFQIYLPLSELDAGDVKFISMPHPFDLKNVHGEPIYKVLDFSSKQKVKGEEVKIEMGYKSKVEKPIPNNGAGEK